MLGPYALPSGWQLEPAGSLLTYRLPSDLSEEPVRCTVKALPMGDHLVVWGLAANGHPAINITLGPHFLDAGMGF